jgi:hypothetical protein
VDRDGVVSARVGRRGREVLEWLNTPARTRLWLLWWRNLPTTSTFGTPVCRVVYCCSGPGVGGGRRLNGAGRNWPCSKPLPIIEDLQGASPDVVPETRQHFVNAAFCPSLSADGRILLPQIFYLTQPLHASPSPAGILLCSARATCTADARRERLHRLHGEGWTRRLAQEPEPIRFALQQSLWAVHPYAEQLLSSVDDELVHGE